jgi:hypothetical protein
LNFGQKPEVDVQEQAIPSLPDSLTVPPFGVNIHSFPVRWLSSPRKDF